MCYLPVLELAAGLNLRRSAASFVRREKYVVMRLISPKECTDLYEHKHGDPGCHVARNRARPTWAWLRAPEFAA